jgi:hypothetical protein
MTAVEIARFHGKTSVKRLTALVISVEMILSNSPALG